MARKMDAIEAGDPGTRASMDGQVAGDLRYEDWLKSQKETVQKDVLGPSRFELWKNRSLTLPEMLDQRGNPLTLEQLRARAVPPPPALGGLHSALEKVERDTRELAIEHATLFTPDGGVLVSKTSGKPDRVAFTRYETGQFQGNILTHNHPRGTSLSSQDVGLAAHYGLAEIRASGRFAKYSLEAPAQGWDADYWTNFIEPLYKKYNLEVRSEFWNTIRSGAMTHDEAELRHAHEVWTRVARDLHLTYKRVEW